MQKPPGFVTPRILRCALLGPKQYYTSGLLLVWAASALLTNRTNELSIRSTHHIHNSLGANVDY